MNSKVYIILIIIIAFVGVASLFHPGFFTSHDGHNQLIRLVHFHQGLVDGQFPVRWAGTAMCGLGYPLFIFTYRFPFWLAEIWYRIIPNLGDSIKFVFICTYILSGLSMYWTAKIIWKSRLAGFAASVIYLWAPYRFVDIYVRAALGEAVTFLFIPLLFLSSFQLATEVKHRFRWMLVLAVALSGLLLSHVMTFMVFILPLGIWFITLWLNSKHKLAYFHALLGGFLLSLGLTAYYWFPATYEKSFTQFANLLTDYYHFHFVEFSQLLYSKWGYGVSMMGIADDGMSFQLGFAQWAAVLAFLGVLLLGLVLQPRVLKKLKLVRISSSFIALGTALFITFGISLYLMLEPASWFYRLVNKYMVIDFPWKFLAVAVVCCSLLLGGVIRTIIDKRLRYLTVLGFIALAFYANRNHIRVNQYVYTPDSEYWQSMDTSNTFEDYKPRWFTQRCVSNQPELLTHEGESENHFQGRSSNHFIFTTTVFSPEAKIFTKLTYYPGWKAYVDQTEVKVYEDHGQIAVVIPQGNHTVRLIYTELIPVKVSNWVSVATLFALIITVALYERRKKS